jgi:hypothetical protein
MRLIAVETIAARDRGLADEAVTSPITLLFNWKPK